MESHSPHEAESESSNPPPDIYEKCDSCGISISNAQRIKHFNGKAYHLKPCWRDIRKQANKQAFT